MISLTDYQVFCNKYYGSQLRYQLRFGQAFVNHFNIEHDPQLYYTEHDSEAKAIIFSKYVTPYED